MAKKKTTTDPPEVTLTLGSTLNPDDIKENDDVYFECNVKANPSTVRISWSHDVSILFYYISFEIDLSFVEYLESKEVMKLVSLCAS